MKTRTVLLIVVTAVLLGLSVASALASVSTAEDAIAAITANGKVTYSEDSRAAIDEAVAAVEALDSNLDLEDKVPNIADLDAAKVEYVRLAIKTADQANRRKLADGYTDEQISQLVVDARAAVDAYFTEDEYDLVPNYDDLVTLEASVVDTGEEPAAAQQAAETSTQEATTVQLC